MSPAGPLAPAAVADRLAAGAEVIAALLTGVTREQALFQPGPGHWSMLEVINHLADEEAEDFRRRLQLTLSGTGESWPSIDPTGWPAARGYRERDLDESVARFRRERGASLAWLRGLASAHLEAAYAHPKLGTIRAGDLAAAWLAHDLIHVRQLTRLHYRWLERVAAPYRLDYAGPF